jgi:hypothetical protein
MDFYDYATMHDLLRRAGLTKEPPAVFYRELQTAAYLERARGVEGMAVEYNRYTSEYNWCQAGRPYYKLWPGIIPLLAGVGVDVPVDYLRLPFEAFLVRLPMQDNPLRIDDEHVVRSILVHDGENNVGQRRMFLWIDVGEMGIDGSPILTFCQLDCQPGLAIEAAFNLLPRQEAAFLRLTNRLPGRRRDPIVAVDSPFRRLQGTDERLSIRTYIHDQPLGQPDRRTAGLRRSIITFR